MFNFNSLLAGILVALLSFASAMTTKPGADADPTIEICVGAINPPICVTRPVASESCINLVGDLSAFNKEITAAQVPRGFNCTFFQNFGCITSGTGTAGTDSEVVLQPGTWNFSSVPGLSGTINFNDLASSFICLAL